MSSTTTTPEVVDLERIGIEFQSARLRLKLGPRPACTHTAPIEPRDFNAAFCAAACCGSPGPRVPPEVESPHVIDLRGHLGTSAQRCSRGNSNNRGVHNIVGYKTLSLSTHDDLDGCPSTSAASTQLPCKPCLRRMGSLTSATGSEKLCESSTTNSLHISS